MDLYIASLAAWVLANVGLAYGQRSGKDTGEKTADVLRASASQTKRNFRYRYFMVYILVVASDWLQV